PSDDRYCSGLVRVDGSRKLAAQLLQRETGICQWLHYEHPIFELALEWLRRLGVRHLRTGISWADSYRENAVAWFDRQMRGVEEFATTLTLCFTPEHLGLRRHYTSPPRSAQDFAHFAEWAVGRYAASQHSAAAELGAA